MQVLAAGAGRWLVGTVMIVEHVMVLLCLLLWFCIPSEPQNVREARERRKYIESCEAERNKHAQRMQALQGDGRLTASF